MKTALVVGGLGAVVLAGYQSRKLASNDPGVPERLRMESIELTTPRKDWTAIALAMKFSMVRAHGYDADALHISNGKPMPYMRAMDADVIAAYWRGLAQPYYQKAGVSPWRELEKCLGKVGKMIAERVGVPVPKASATLLLSDLDPTDFWMQPEESYAFWQGIVSVAEALITVDATYNETRAWSQAREALYEAAVEAPATIAAATGEVVTWAASVGAGLGAGVIGGVGLALLKNPLFLAGVVAIGYAYWRFKS